MSLYDEIIDYIKSRVYYKENNLEWEEHDMEYNHPLAGIEKSHIFNADGVPSFDINKIEEMSDDDLENIQKYFNDFENANRFRVRTNYGEGDELTFRYYTNNDYIIPFASVAYFREVRNNVAKELRERQMKRRNQNANDLIPILNKFIEKHSKNNPTLYPDWLTFNFYEVSYGDLITQPVVDIEKLLKSGDKLSIAKNTRNLLERIWNRLLNSDAYRSYSDSSLNQVKPKLRFTNVKFDDWNYYMKNVVNKQIKPSIKNIPRAKECVHSIIFRFRGGIDYIEIQIHPRFRKDCTDNYWSRFNTYDFKNQMKDVLADYGWKLNINYSDSTWKD